MKTMHIGSGDVSALMSGLDTQAHGNLLRKFVSDEYPNYNAKASPIDALRTGAILEERYYLTLSDGYYPQFHVTAKEMDVFVAHLDFAKLEAGNVVDFDELKTMSFNDFLSDLELIKDDNDILIAYLKKKHKAYYNQVQEQLYCTGLDSCNVVFVAVLTYDDDDNYSREIQPNEIIKVRVERDEKVIAQIKERAVPFQMLRTYYTCKP